MHPFFATLAAMSLSGAPESTPASTTPSPPIEVQQVAPSLYDYTRDVLFGQNWKQADLSPRDRSLVTLSSLVAGGRTAQLTSHLKLGLDNGLKPSEIVGLITHLAFYSGWPNAMSAVGVVKEVFAERGIDLATLNPGNAALLPIDAAAEAKRAATVAANVAPLAPELARYTDEVLFADLWRRPDLSPRDRSLVTVAALITQGQAEQLPFHLNRAMDNGLTQAQVGEVITHLAFYAGWPRAMSAVPVAQSVFATRAATP
ncbi:carboxymuconolactone decarboxylase family protein [Pseudoxanthomonas sp.]|uniref:carboxymuconolactone decarboxylase family protein n=1 Tax=Pseudoxanthomonas sp. TaxID=1871049 RepID=UPI0031F2F17B